MTIVADAITARQLPANVAATIAIEQVPGLSGSSIAISVGHDVGGKRRKTGQVLADSAADAAAFVADTGRFGAFLAQALRAIPLDSRPAVPVWADDALVRSGNIAAATRAETLARRALRDAASLPFAA